MISRRGFLAKIAAILPAGIALKGVCASTESVLPKNTGNVKLPNGSTVTFKDYGGSDKIEGWPSVAPERVLPKYHYVNVRVPGWLGEMETTTIWGEHTSYICEIPKGSTVCFNGRAIVVSSSKHPPFRVTV